MMPVRKEERSNSLNLGCSSSAINMVGTPWMVVQRSLSTAFNDARYCYPRQAFFVARRPQSGKGQALRVLARARSLDSVEAPH